MSSNYCPGYVLNCLDEDDLILVSEHLAVCSRCQTELNAYQVVADEMTFALPDAAPPPGLKHQLADRIRLALAQPSSSRWNLFTTHMRRTAPVWGAVSLLLLLVLTISNIMLWQQISQSEMTQESGDMQAIPLSSTGLMPEASGYIIISADGWDGALVVDELPPLDPEQQYQLWLIRDGERTSGAVFSVDEGGYGGTRIRAPESLFEYSTVGVTIEPSGGSPGPTGDKVLGGSLN